MKTLKTKTLMLRVNVKTKMTNYFCPYLGFVDCMALTVEAQHPKLDLSNIHNRIECSHFDK